MADELSGEDMQRINEAIFSGQKIRAVKLYRVATGCGLAEAKEFVDQLGERLKAEHPDEFTCSSGGGGCSSQAALMVGVGAAIWWLLSYAI